MRQRLPALIILVIVVCSGTALADPQKAVLEATKVSGRISTKASAAVWRQAPGQELSLYRQRTVRLNDRRANRELANLGPRQCVVSAVYNHNTLGIRVVWADDAADRSQSDETDVYGDALAIQFPTEFGPGVSLPHIAMGDGQRPVIVHAVRAGTALLTRHFVAAGFGSLTALSNSPAKFSMNYDPEALTWTAILVRPLKDTHVDLRSGLVPMALALWDGSKAERGGNKSVASWKFLRLGKYKLNKEYFDAVTWGEDSKPVGSVSRGAILAAQSCVACHRFAKHQTALAGFAPDLSGIGGYSTSAYLRDSLLRPGQVVVRNLNGSRHYSKAATGKHGAFRENEVYRWYSVDPQGKRISKMPSFEALSETDINDIVAYLKSLKGPAR